VSGSTVAPRDDGAFVDLYWLPLGAGGHVVRWSGLLYEAVVARRERRRRRPLFHAALRVGAGTGSVAIEQAPAWGVGSGTDVVAGGPVGSRWLGRVRLFRYEVRCRRDGVIPDVVHAAAPPQRLSDDPGVARRVLALAAEAPTPVWGRDELGTGEMWTSNALVAWMLVRAGIPVEAVDPAGGRAPGWAAGVSAARRDGPRAGPPTARSGRARRGSRAGASA
jgi:hypothetical protein